MGDPVDEILETVSKYAHSFSTNKASQQFLKDLQTGIDALYNEFEEPERES
jgi:hypothetical protein